MAGQPKWVRNFGNSLPRCSASLAPDAPRLRAVGQRLPQQMIFRRRRDDGIALAAKAAVEFGLREQGADLGLAAGGQ